MTINFHAVARASFEEHTSEATQNSAAPVLEFLSHGFQVTWFREISHLIWVAVLKPDREIATQFGLRQEVLLIGNSFGKDFHQRTLKYDPPAELEDRVDRSVRFVFSDAPVAEAFCAAWAQKHKASVVVIRTPDDGRANSDALYALLGQSLWRRDLFAESEPVRLASDFFGRQAAVNELLAKILSGSPVGVFGLRKIGKSSLLGRVEDLLRAEEDAVTATVQLRGNTTRFKSGRWWHLAEAMLRGWADTLQRTADSIDSKIRAKCENLVGIVQRKAGNEQALAAALEKDIIGLLRTARALAHALQRDEARLVLLLDEFDHLYPDAVGAGHWSSDFFSFWNTVQAIKRNDDIGEQLVFVFGGVNPSGVERGDIASQPNPLFETQRIYLGPMSEDDAGLMLSGIGARMGLVFDDSATKEIYGIVGGHPMLLRRMGSAIHEGLGVRKAVSYVGASDVRRVFKSRKREFFNQIAWVLQHLKLVAPDEERLLRDIATGGAQAYGEIWRDVEFRETFAMHLERYGLIRFTDDLPEIPLALLRDALRQPAASEFAEQKSIVKGFVDELENAIRGRLRVDLERDRTEQETIDAIVSAIPGDAKNRPLNREQRGCPGVC